MKVTLAEYNFCYKPVSTATNFAQTRGASLLRAGSANNAVVEDGGVAGFCDLTTDYGSNRQAVVTQVAVSVPTDAASDIPLKFTTRNKHLGRYATS